MNTIYAGAAPIKRLGKHQMAMAEFFLKYQGWHSVQKDGLTQRTLKSLLRRGLLKANEFEQYHWTQPKHGVK